MAKKTLSANGIAALLGKATRAKKKASPPKAQTTPPPAEADAPIEVGEETNTEELEPEGDSQSDPVQTEEEAPAEEAPEPVEINTAEFKGHKKVTLENLQQEEDDTAEEEKTPAPKEHKKKSDVPMKEEKVKIDVALEDENEEEYDAVMNTIDAVVNRIYKSYTEDNREVTKVKVSFNTNQGVEHVVIPESNINQTVDLTALTELDRVALLRTHGDRYCWTIVAKTGELTVNLKKAAAVSTMSYDTFVALVNTAGSVEAVMAENGFATVEQDGTTVIATRK